MGRVVTGVKVEIWSDVVCPWCYVGKRRFEAALARFEHAADVEVEWKSFELDPSAPPSADRPGGQAEHLASKYGRSLEQAQQMLDQMTATAAGEGLDYRFDIMRGGNSFDAHRLLHLAKARGGLELQDTFKERLDKGTFTEGLSVSDHDELTRIAVDVGLDEAEVREVLASGAFADEVRADVAQGRAYGINGVPFFVLDGRYGVSGAQPADHLLAALEQSWSTRTPLRTLQPAAGSDGGEACEGDSCAI